MTADGEVIVEEEKIDEESSAETSELNTEISAFNFNENAGDDEKNKSKEWKEV